MEQRQCQGCSFLTVGVLGDQKSVKPKCPIMQCFGVCFFVFLLKNIVCVNFVQTYTQGLIIDKSHVEVPSVNDQTRT